MPMSESSSSVPGTLFGAAKHLWVSAFNGAYDGTCRGNDACSAKVAWSAVERKYKKGPSGSWVAKSLAEENIYEAEMFITKASFDPKTGAMRWAAVASNTERDRHQTRMSVDLFKSFVKRQNDPAPEPFQSEFWKGGPPYLSISHYLDLNGKAIAGMAEEIYVDGDLLKSKGYFGNEQNPEVARAAYESVKADIKSSAPQDKRVRMSIAFVDFEHTHGDVTFRRRSLTEKCPMCQSGLIVDEFKDGYLVQLALTRVPSNGGTSIALEERSMTTKKSDAASIVGEELAEVIDAEDQKLVERTETPELVIKSEVVPVPTAEATPPPTPVPPTSLAEVVGDPWVALDTVLDGINASDGRSIDKPAAVKKAIADFKATFVVPISARSTANETRSDAKKSTEDIHMPHVLDPSFDTLRSVYDTIMADKKKTRAEKIAALQTPLNDMGSLLQRSVNESTPAPAFDADAFTQRFTQMEQTLQQIVTAMQQQPATQQVSSTPQPRQILQTPIQPVQRSEPSKPLTIHEMVRRSVLGPSA